MISKIKDFLGFDIKAEKYKLSHDDTFGMISDANKPDKAMPYIELLLEHNPCDIIALSNDAW